MHSFFRSLLVRSLVLAGLTGTVAQAAGSGSACCQKSTAACCVKSEACCPSTSSCCSDSENQAASTAAYPLETCVVSGEKLGEMGQPYDYIHQEPGKPDRLVRFCCKGCVRDFKKDPAAYLKKLDEAAAPARKA